MELKLGTNHVFSRTKKLNLLFKINMEKGKGPSPLCPITISATSSSTCGQICQGTNKVTFNPKLGHICSSTQGTPSGHYFM
jgi:hypothetical protein